MLCKLSHQFVQPANYKIHKVHTILDSGFEQVNRENSCQNEPVFDIVPSNHKAAAAARRSGLTTRRNLLNSHAFYPLSTLYYCRYSRDNQIRDFLSAIWRLAGKLGAFHGRRQSVFAENFVNSGYKQAVNRVIDRVPARWRTRPLNPHHPIVRRQRFHSLDETL